MAADISAITYFAPIAAFLLVFAVSFAILIKTKVLGEHKLGIMIISFIIATLFVSAAGTITYIRTVVPWVAILLVTTALLLALTGLLGKPADFLNKPISVILVLIFGLIFLVSGFVIFSNTIIPYLPGPSFGTGPNIEATAALDLVYSPRIAGAILLIIISVIVAWVLVKAK